jgi:hypothetical protein
MYIKIDMEKAFDRVKWAFLLKIIWAFGFDKECIEWVMSCANFYSFVIINGEPSVSP